MTGARGLRHRWRRSVRERLRLIVRGSVQGVGFRPYVYRLAYRHDLDGWVNNSADGVEIEVEGPKAKLEQFFLALGPERPPRANIQGLESVWLDPAGLRGFEIRESAEGGAATTVVSPDIAICDDCRAEILDPTNRRYGYPFTNCTNCGPRFSLIEALPYDRINTSMRGFTMCAACAREYGDPNDRRFHAQPNACPVCGPQVALWNAAGDIIKAIDPVQAAGDAIRDGKIVAVKGLGGFHLMALASRPAAIEALRLRKRRVEKPFAIMAPSIEGVEAICSVSPVERRLLMSPEAPIVLLRRKRHGYSPIADAVAPGNPWLGVMLPYTPLHCLLLDHIDDAVVATSGNLSDEPICIDEHEALGRLGGIADLFLVHDRPIVRPIDDSIVRVQLGRELVLRRARGYAPLPVMLVESAPPIVAVGAHMKNTIAVNVGDLAFLSQHIGDLETPQALEAFTEVIDSLSDLYGVTPVGAAADLHPDYLSTRHAANLRIPVTRVQHHYAHVLSAAAENGVTGPFLGVAWDGTGLGTDGTIWGGEFLLVDDDDWERWACLRPFRLPGGDRAVREPRRSALGALYSMFGDRVLSAWLPTLEHLSVAERELMCVAMASGINAPVTSSAGRLFDVVASITGVRQQMSFEGQAAMELEWAVDPSVVDGYPCDLRKPDPGDTIGSFNPPPLIVDWRPAMNALLDDLAAGASLGLMAARWHSAMADAITAVARSAGRTRVVLSGGCFQNAALCERTDWRLRAGGFQPCWHQRVPPNDGGIALGQLAAAVRDHRGRVETKERRVTCA
jgi:hydrogenase maturation protein HypF